MRSLLILLVALLLCLAASYGLRYGLMENQHWVAVCSGGEPQWPCQARAGLGLLIHFSVLAGAALLAAVLAMLLPGRSGRVLAVLALFLAIPALVLYSATLAAFAAVIAGLRLVRRARLDN